jgi:hypothetical protein
MATDSVYKAYSALNAQLARGDELFMTVSDEGGRFDDRPRPHCRRLRRPRIGIFAGRGTSHSWLWFVDLFDRMGFWQVAFVDESDVRTGALDGLDVLAVSGGDTFAVAKGLGPRGAGNIRGFIEAGGLYIGSCAGAYLPMHSSKPHLEDFNFAAVKITNLSKLLPDCRRNEHKFFTAYGCDYVFHPVREAVRLTSQDQAPFGGRGSFDAPLYGGPGMQAAEPSQVLAVYDGFTAATQYLVSEAVASDTLLGRAAVVRSPMGAGRMYLFGPHFEHPHFAEANRRVADAILWDGNRGALRTTEQSDESQMLPPEKARRLIHVLKRELSNARIVATGIEMAPVCWLIGAKYYEPEKIRVFLEAMWRRLRSLEKQPRPQIAADIEEPICAWATETTRLLREIKQRLDRKEDTLQPAERLFRCLNRYAIGFFRIYFETFSPPT